LFFFQHATRQLGSLNTPPSTIAKAQVATPKKRKRQARVADPSSGA